MDKFGSLNLFNEAFLEPSQGFEEHGHREMEVFTYMVSGELEQSVPVLLHIKKQFLAVINHASPAYFSFGLGRVSQH